MQRFATAIIMKSSLLLFLLLLKDNSISLRLYILLASNGTKNLTLELLQRFQVIEIFQYQQKCMDTSQKRKFLKNLIKLEMSGKIAHKKLWGKLVIDKQKSLGKPRLFAYNICPLQTTINVSQRFITLIFTIISTFPLLANSYVFYFHGTKTEQLDSLKMRKKIKPTSKGRLVLLFFEVDCSTFINTNRCFF